MKRVTPRIPAIAKAFEDMTRAEAARSVGLERLALRNAIPGFDTVMAQAARANGVDLLTAAALSGHEVCSPRPWVFGYDPTPVADPSFPDALYHPDGRAMNVTAPDRRLFP